jgi:peptidyl-prolyl cis-trans isomerase SurA
MKRFFSRVMSGALPVVLATLCTLAVARAEVIDRIVAKVNGHIILQSDLDDALRYEALMSGKPLDQFTDDDRRAVLDRLVDQELLDEQMKSTTFRHASEAEADARVAGARKLYPAGATPEGWQTVLQRFQLNEKDLLAHVEQQIDLMRLVDARLRPQVQIDSKSIEAYYRDKFVPQLKQAGADEVPLADVSSKIRELLTQEKVNQLLVSWLHNLRSESKVTIADAHGPAIEGVESQ